ncbi:MAG: PTS sugar transporter subunit IIA [Erysipelotrichaceae bacterium]
MNYKILLLTHGGWGLELKKSVEMIIGKIDFVEEVALKPENNLQEFKTEVLNKIENLKKEDNGNVNITILTDLFGGTTTNVAAVIANQENKEIRVFAGLNSPLLLEASSQILFTGKLDCEQLLKVSKDSIFDVMERIYRKDEQNG